VARPRIAGALGTPDQQDGVRVRTEDDRHRGPNQWIVTLVREGLSGGEAAAEEGEAAGQWLWVWQPPPQQPPPGGGPSRLRSAGFPPVAGGAVRDMSRSRFRPSHSGQVTVVSDRTSRSNRASHAVQRYV
jgi:hypothetical protein